MQKGQGLIILLILISALGVIAFFAVSNTFSFKHTFFGQLFYKPASNASEGVEIEHKPGSESVLVNFQNLESDWIIINKTCSKLTAQNKLLANCQDLLIKSRKVWLGNENFIARGEAVVEGESLAKVGIMGASGKILAESPTQSGDNKFKIVMAKVEDKNYVYYYYNDDTEPRQKLEVTTEDEMSVFLSCAGSCQFGELTFVGTPKL